mgnify:CR=1 FL=1|jgi:hypothetical protein
MINDQQRRLLFLALLILFVFATLGIILVYFYFSVPRVTTTPPITIAPEMCCSNNPIRMCMENQGCGPGGICIASGNSGVFCNTCESQGMIMTPDGSGCISYDDFFNISPTTPPISTAAPIVTTRPRSTLAPNLFMQLPASVAGPARRN